MDMNLYGRIKSRLTSRKTWLIPVLIISVVITAMPLLAGGCEGVFEDCDDAPIEYYDDNFTVDGSAAVVVRTGNGGIEVNSGSDDEVLVQATVRDPEKIDYRVSQEGNTITVEAKPKDGRSWRSCMQASIVLTVPARTDFELETSNGAIALRGIEGSGNIKTSNGSIGLFDVKGDFEGTTSNGSLTIDGLAGSVALRTSNGAVNARDVIGEVDLDTSNGGVDVQGLVGEANLETSNGSLSFKGELTAGGDNRLVTSNGQVEVELLGVPSVSLEVLTHEGKIRTTLPITTTLVEDDHITGIIGDGEADLYVRTTNGDVTIS
jgi:hypothetical protein